MKIGDFRSLTQMARKLPHDEEFAKRLREKGTEILNNAEKVLLDQHSSLTPAQALADLKDLEGALKVCMSKERNRKRQNWHNGQEKEKLLNEKGVQMGILHDASEKKVFNEPRIPGMYPGGRYELVGKPVISEGWRKCSRETVYYQYPGYDKMEGVKQFIKDIDEMISAYQRTVISNRPDQLNAKGVACVLDDLRDRLKQVKTVPANHAQIIAERKMTEYEQLPIGFKKALEQRLLGPVKKETVEVSRIVETTEFDPAHISMPTSGILRYTELG